MSDIIHADIFFFITAISVGVVTVALLVALIYIIKILADARYVTRKVRSESDEIIDDINRIRANLKKGSFKISQLLSLLPLINLAKKVKKAKIKSQKEKKTK